MNYEPQKLTLASGLYFYLYRFFCCLPSKREASSLAATFVPVFFGVNFLVILFSAEILLDAHLRLPHGKIIPSIIGSIAWLWSYWWYEVSGRGEKIVASLSDSKMAKNGAVIGGIIFTESMLGAFIPAMIAVIQNPTPWQK